MLFHIHGRHVALAAMTTAMEFARVIHLRRLGLAMIHRAEVAKVSSARLRRRRVERVSLDPHCDPVPAPRPSAITVLLRPAVRGRRFRPLRREVPPHQGVGPVPVGKPLDRAPSDSSVEPLGGAGVEPQGRDAEGRGMRLDRRDQRCGISPASNLRGHEDAGEPGGQVGPRIEVVRGQARHADGLVVDEEHDGARHRAAAGGALGFGRRHLGEAASLALREGLPAPARGDGDEVGPLGGGDDRVRHRALPRTGWAARRSRQCHPCPKRPVECSRVCPHSRQR